MKMIPITAMGIMTTTVMGIMIMMTSTGIMATAMEIIMETITAAAITAAVTAADTIIDLRGNCKTSFEPKSALSSPVLKSSNLDSEASFAIPSSLDLFPTHS